MRFMRFYKKAYLHRSYSTGMEIAKRWPSPRQILWRTLGNPFCLTTAPCPVAYAAPAEQLAACWLRHRRPRRPWPCHAIAPPKMRLQTIHPLSCTIKILICNYRISNEIINYEREYLNYSPEAGNRFLFSTLTNESRLWYAPQ